MLIPVMMNGPASFRQMVRMLAHLSVLAALLAAPTQGEGGELEIIGGEVPPFSMLQENDPSGIAIDFTAEVVREAGFEMSFQILPWRRAMREVQKGPDRLLAGIARSPEREDDYAWVEPIIEARIAYVALRSAPTSPKVQRRARTCVHAGTPMEARLEADGDADVITADHEQHCLSYLLRGYVSQWLTETSLAFTLASMAGEPPDRLIIRKPLMTLEMYVAAKPTMPPDRMRRLQDAADDLKARGVLEDIVRRYLGFVPEGLVLP